jgi:GNAT superfamily N-acetyltransferase
VRSFGNGLVVCRTRPEHAEQLGELQKIIFPTLAPEERFEARHYRKHVELFPEGQFVVLDGERVAGASSTIRYNFDFAHPDHRFADIIEGGWLTSHQPAGAWLYGADIGTHPDYRRRGVARALYAARHELVRARARRSGHGRDAEWLRRGQARDPRRGLRAELVAGRARSDDLARKASGSSSAASSRITSMIRCDRYGVVLVLPADRVRSAP